MKRGMLLVGILLMFNFFISLVYAQIMTNTYAVNMAVCRGGNLGSPSDCTTELNKTDDIKFTIGGIGKTTNQAYVNGTWNISLSSSFTLIEVIGIFEWMPQEDAIYTLKWYFWNFTSSSYQAVGCPNSVQIGPLGDIISICNLTDIYKTIISLQSIRLENEINASASKKISIDYFAINVTYNPDITPPNLSITYPSAAIYQSVTELNYTVSSDATSCKYSLDLGVNNNTITCGNNITGLSVNSGSNSWTVYASDSNNNENNSLVTFTIDNAAPTLTIDSPEAKTYGYNTSLSLNFSVSDLSGISSCWYNLDNGNNVSITNCENSSFNAIDGSHILYLFANDTLNNIQQTSVSFSVLTTSPAVNLIYPLNNSYLNYINNIYFNYSVVSGIGISSCELWGDFTGSWQLNQTNSSISLENNFFVLNLTNKNYNFGIYCNDTQNRFTNVNYTFTIDTINPSLIISEPTGAKNSRTIQANWQVSDANLQTCWYGVYRGASIEVANTTVNCYSNTTTFSVTVDADFIFNFYANDSAGNLNFSSSSFTVSTASQPPNPPPGDGGGGGGGTIIPPNKTGKLKLSSLEDVIINPGESKTLSLTVKNIGTVFLNKCKLEGREDSISLISSKDVKSLAIGQQEDFVFILNMPENFSTKIIEIQIKCNEAEETTSFNIHLSKNILEAELLSVKQENKLNFVYLVREKAGKEQEVNVVFWLENELGKVSEGKDSFIINANQQLERQGSLDLPSYSGEFVLHIDLESKEAIINLKEPVLIGKSIGLIGRVLLVTGGSKILIIAALVCVSAFFIIYILRRLIKKPLKEDRTGYVKIKLGKKER